MRGALRAVAVVAACSGGHGATPDAAPVVPDAAQPFFGAAVTYLEQQGAAWESPGNLVTVLLHR